VVGNLYIDNGSGGSTTTLTDSNVGAVRPPIGSELTRAFFASGGNVTVLNGAGEDSFTLDNSDSGIGVDGNLFISNGDGGSDTALNQTFLGGSLTIFNGQGLDTFRATGLGSFDNLGQPSAGLTSLYINNSDGGSSAILSNITVGGDVTLLNGAGHDEFILNDTDGGVGVLGNLFIANGDGGSATAIGNSVVLGNVTVLNGDSFDGFVVNNIGSAGGINGSLLIINSNGASDTELRNTTVGGSATLFNGDGHDDLTISDSNRAGGVDGNLAVFNGNGGSNTLLREATMLGSVAVYNGDGANVTTVTIDDSAAHTIASDLTVNSGSAADSVVVRGYTIGGNFSVDTGAGNDNVAIDNCNVSGWTRITTGPAVIGGGQTDQDYVNIERQNLSGPSTFTGPFYLWTGDGDDTVNIGWTTSSRSAHFDGGGFADGGLGSNELAYGIANTGLFTSVNF
jgi:hypothetical protein